MAIPSLSETMKPIRESRVERKFREGVEALGCQTRKLIGCRNDPDRLVLAPGGWALFLELKRPGEVPREGQLKRLQELRDLGFPAGWTDNADDGINWVRKELKREI